MLHLSSYKLQPLIIRDKQRRQFTKAFVLKCCVRACLVGLLSFIVVGWLTEQDARMDSFQASIPVGTNPNRLAVNTVTNKIYVANLLSNNVTVINGADNTTATVTAGNGPTDIAVNPVTNKIYVANANSNNVTVINGVDNSSLTVTTGSHPSDIAVNTVTNKIYVANLNSNNVTVINGADNTTATVTTGNSPTDIAVNSVTNKIYVANNFTDNVTVINGADNTTVTVAASSQPIAIAVNTGTNRIYVANFGSNNVTVINGADNTKTTVTAGGQPIAIVVNSVSNKIYVVNRNSNNVTVINGADNTTTTVTAGNQPTAASVNLTTNKIYVANLVGSNVTVINGADNTTQTIAVGAMPLAIDVNTATNRIYVANGGGNDVTVINGADTTQNLIQFSASNYSVNEGSGSAIVMVTRSGDSNGTASVSYRTTDSDTFTVGCADIVQNQGAAFGRCDFATTIDTLTFAAGETTKTLTVPIIDDSWSEGNETFGISLSNVSGASLGTTSNATITIVDNDTVTGPNPIFLTTFFVRQQYLDFLSREPEVGEPWSAVLNNCSDVNNNPTCNRTIVSASFFGSPEFQLKGYFVYRFYKLGFNRLPNYTEIVSDMRTVTGQTATDLFQKKGAFTNAFVLRPEFVTTYNGLSNAQFVTTLMGRYGLTQITTPDPAAPDGTTKVTLTTIDLQNGLAGGTLTRAQVLRAIADSDQVFNLEYNSAFVAMQYFGYLRRAPDAVGFNAWLDYLNLHPSDSLTMVNGFMNSPEYLLRFGPR